MNSAFHERYLKEAFNGRRWKYVVEIASLWSKARLRMTDANHQGILNSDTNLFTGILKTCSLHDLSAVQLKPLLQAIIASSNSSLKSLELHSCSVSGLHPDLLEVLTRLEELKLYGCYLSLILS